ncbi:unnamed protein product [Phaedon cochleariae]|uniref:Choline O-acetyltransferase n=1 Tax=Phaedon cochleariae TaxID=80249 RepID=A0A9P0GLY9_PHACE|nr:unnamed protein product [Phaedon cochleariae]
MLHGGGHAHNSGNRWFDKTVQLIISGDGACGLCYEHSNAEGVAVIRLVEELWRRADQQVGGQVEVPASGGHLPPPERMEWGLETRDVRRIEEAGQVLDGLVKDLDFQVFRFTGYGKNFIKSCKVSPDVFIQLALQLAYYKLYGRLTATYESASTRRFRYGRVDCIRSATPEALAWEAVSAQTTEMVDNILGQGIDIHLLGLREAARETSPTAASPLPTIFTDPSYRLANKFLLTTSQISTSSDSFMGYGPVEEDGYGASYDPKGDGIIFCLSAFWSSESTSSSKFAQSLEESLIAMQSLLKKPTSDSFMGYGPVEEDGYGASYDPKGDGIIFCLSAFWSSESTSSSKFAQSLEESLIAMQSLLKKPTSDSFMGYGPVEEDGYGASYDPKGDGIIFCLSAFWSSESTSSSKFAQSLEESLIAMQSLLKKPTYQNNYGICHMMRVWLMHTHCYWSLAKDPSYQLANKFLLTTSQISISSDSFMGYRPVEEDGYGTSDDPKAIKFLPTTSQISTSSDSFMGYGPVEEDEYGASYDPKGDGIIFCLSALWNFESTSSSKFAQSLEESLMAMQSLLKKPT